MFVFTKEMAEKLKKVRKESRLSQKEVGIRMGLKMDSAQAYIARLERGEIKNPSLKTILDYLSVCNYAWSKFFSELSAIQFNLSHNEIMRKVEIPRYYQKIDRDVAKYTHSIQTKFSQKQNIKPLTLQKQEKMATEFLKYRTVIEQIEQEVTKLMGNTEEPGLVNQFYKSFARECYRTLKTHGLSPKSEAKLRARFLIWQNRGLKRELLEKVKEIAIKYLAHI